MLRTATVSGKVYDEAGSTVNAAKVHIRSLNPASPFETTVDVNNGAYVVNSVPAGVQVEVSVSKDGWTSRSRVESLLPSENSANVYNFGGPVTAQDANGPNFFISNYPEIVSAVGAYADGKLTWTIRFSEVLDATNRGLVENALVIDTPNPAVPGTSIAIREGSAFLTDSNQATTSWDAANTTLTLSFSAPLLADDAAEKTYSLAFVRGEADDVIVDAEGKTLGFVTPTALGRYNYPFRLSSLVLTSQATAEDRWKATHTWSASLKVAKDETDPVLVSLASSPLISGATEYRRVALTFSEPMQAYPQVRSAALADLAANYVFAYSNESAEEIEMSGTVAATVTGPADVQMEVPFRFTTGSGVLINYGTSDAKVVYVDIPRSLIPANASHIKVRVNNLQDPAGNSNATGNAVSASKTADHIKIGPLK